MITLRCNKFVTSRTVAAMNRGAIRFLENRWCEHETNHMTTAISPDDLGMNSVEAAINSFEAAINSFEANKRLADRAFGRPSGWF